MTGSEALAVKPARPRDADAVASLHAESIREGFLSSLGPAFLSILYRAMVHSPDVTLLVALSDGRPVGFVAGAVQPRAFYQSFLRHNAFRASMAIAPQAIKPQVARKLMETLRHMRRASTPSRSELFAIAVEPGSRRHGAGAMLEAKLEEDLLAAGATDLTVVVSAANDDARAFYERRGFTDPMPVEVHRGEPSVRYAKALTVRSEQ